jgi:glutamine synthetase adenylyltransferase
MGFQDPAAAYEGIRALRDSPVTRSLSETGRQRLDRLMPCCSVRWRSSTHRTRHCPAHCSW